MSDMTTPELDAVVPPLPEPTQGLGIHRWSYSGMDMQAYATAAVLADRERSIDMVLYCPKCGLQHIDKPEGQFYPGMTADDSAAQNDASGLWNNPPHRSHLCHSCGHIWRPADVSTNGVAVVKTTGKGDSPKVFNAATLAQIAAARPDLMPSMHGILAKPAS